MKLDKLDKLDLSILDKYEGEQTQKNKIKFKNFILDFEKDIRQLKETEVRI